MPITKKQIKPVIVLLILTAITGTLFQNCSKVAVTDLASSEKAQEIERLALGKDEETVTAGLNPVPDLKMFFVVDNSGTMKENQLNLSESFAAMFDRNSADSLSKFDTTAYLFNTAQRSPSLSSERDVLDQISSKQAGFNVAGPISNADYSSSYRSATNNTGLVPGDNIGYQLTKSQNPSQYFFSLAPVLGTSTQADGSLVWSRSIHKKASEDSVALEKEFKERLKVLDSERIPLVSVDGKYKPENSSIVDTESGLCAVARVLRNPESFIKAGDLLSFIIVSDEDENDPSGSNCVQSYKEFTGTEDLVDGVCSRKETAFSYKTTSTNTTPDTCNLNGQKGYNVRVTYPNLRYTTTVTYKIMTNQAQYSVPVTTLTYKSKSTSYKYLYTNINYYYETCADVVSDGLVVGKKCTLNAAPATNSVQGDFTSDCYGLAKSLNASAVNTAGKTPVCSAVYKSISSCDVSDSKCQATTSLSDKVISNLLGAYTSSSCLAKAQSYSDFASGTTPVCVGSTINVVGSCNVDQISAGCVKTADPTYGTKTVTVGSDLTTTSTGCYNWAKTQSGNAVTVAGDITTCQKNTVNENLQYNFQLNFADTKASDGGTSLPAGDCQNLKSLAMAQAKKVKPQIVDTDICQIVGYFNATQSKENLLSDCATQAQNRCVNENLRSCSGTLVAGTTSNTVSNALAFKTVQEQLSCTSKCSDSKLGVCDKESASNQTIEDYLKKMYGATTACSASVRDLGVVENHTALLTADEANICKASLDGVPSYYARTKGPYHLVSTEVDYVAGSVKESGITKPKMNLINYIKSRSAEISQIAPIFATIVRKPGDPLGLGGSTGLEYLKLVNNGNDGQVESVLSKDYSVVLKDLSKVLKSKLERSFVLQKMLPQQVITKVSLVPKDSKQAAVELERSMWVQSGTTLTLDKSLDFNDGDQFRVEFQNYLKQSQ